MKRNISLFVLAFEIVAIVVLHAVKMSHLHTSDQDANRNFSRATGIKSPVVKSYSLLSIK